MSGGDRIGGDREGVGGIPFALKAPPPSQLSGSVAMLSEHCHLFLGHFRPGLV